MRVLVGVLVLAHGVALQLSALSRVLRREYSSFFAPFEQTAYAADVRFEDPLTSFSGAESYKRNVDMLGGRTFLGKLLFRDSSISLHNVTEIAPNKLVTRWTLRTTVTALPWKPTAKFTGISEYEVNEQGLISAQVDYWDSVNLKAGQYQRAPAIDGVKDFLSQLRDSKGNAELAAAELPYELLRRAARYEVRRYPPTVVAETAYEQRPEGYDRLGSYAGGSNEGGAKLQVFSPTLMAVSDADGTRSKRMSWPLAFALPGEALRPLSGFPQPSIRGVRLARREGLVVGVARFEMAATEPVVRGYTKRLVEDLDADGIDSCAAARQGDVTTAQFDALFSLNKRRNEVWVALDTHPWQ